MGCFFRNDRSSSWPKQFDKVDTAVEFYEIFTAKVDTHVLVEMTFRYQTAWTIQQQTGTNPAPSNAPCSFAALEQVIIFKYRKSPAKNNRIQLCWWLKDYTVWYSTNHQQRKSCGYQKTNINNAQSNRSCTHTIPPAQLPIETSKTLFLAIFQPFVAVRKLCFSEIVFFGNTHTDSFFFLLPPPLPLFLTSYSLL